MFKLKQASVEHAINHLVRYGDTDIFPHLPEFVFFGEEKNKVVAELSGLDLDSYSPAGAMEGLAPKSRFGFRIAHQLGAIDNVLLLACVIEIGHLVEGHRLSGSEAFSYRFKLGTEGEIFATNHTFKDWINDQVWTMFVEDDIKSVVVTDISDFYLRINFHRLENYLDEIAPQSGAAKFIKRYIKFIRAKQSFGLPVGGNAARLLAELALCDTDQALFDHGFKATRFVDDYRIFLKPEEDAYEVLALLADQLGINEGLSLNVSKTAVYSAEEYTRILSGESADVAEQAEADAIAVLTAQLYADDDPDPAEIQKLGNLNLLAVLEAELEKPFWNVGRIKVIFRALKLTKKSGTIEYVKENFGRLLIFAKELTLLMQALEENEPNCFDDLLDVIINAILSPPAASVHVIQAWLLELFVRGIIPIPLNKLKQLDGLQFPVHARQLLLIRGRLGDKNYFRKSKTALDHFSYFELPCLVWGAGCLPADEFVNWLPALKSKLKTPCASLFCDWVMTSKGTLTAKLGGDVAEDASSF